MKEDPEDENYTTVSGRLPRCANERKNGMRVEAAEILSKIVSDSRARGIQS